MPRGTARCEHPGHVASCSDRFPAVSAGTVIVSVSQQSAPSTKYLTCLLSLQGLRMLGFSCQNLGLGFSCQPGLPTRHAGAEPPGSAAGAAGAAGCGQGDVASGRGRSRGAGRREVGGRPQGRLPAQQRGGRESQESVPGNSWRKHVTLRPSAAAGPGYAPQQALMLHCWCADAGRTKQDLSSGRVPTPMAPWSARLHSD